MIFSSSKLPIGAGRFLTHLGLMVPLLLVVCSVCFAPKALSAALSQGYHSTEDLAPGSIVAILASKNTVQAADTLNSDGLLGVVVTSKTSTLALSNQGDRLQVATSGNASIFISDINGPVKAGDQVAPSPIKGVGMKATDSGKVVGVAQGDFDGSKSFKTVPVKTKNGQSQPAKVGSIPISVQVVYYTVPSKTAVPPYVQQFANVVAGKPVSLARITAGSIIILAALLVVVILLFSAVRGAVVSLGRNPLAKKSIYRGMMQVGITSVVIMGVAVTGAYVVLNY